MKFGKVWKAYIRLVENIFSVALHVNIDLSKNNVMAKLYTYWFFFERFVVWWGFCFCQQASKFDAFLLHILLCGDSHVWSLALLRWNICCCSGTSLREIRYVRSPISLVIFRHWLDCWSSSFLLLFSGNYNTIEEKHGESDKRVKNV